MTVQEVIQKCEDAYGKSLDLNQRQIYLDYLKRYTPDQLDSLVDATIQASDYFPRISNFHSAATDLGIKVEVQRPNPDKDCKDCRGTGWVGVKKLNYRTGDQYRAVVPCACFPRPKYTPGGQEDVPF
jgi:hypothetical protein